MYLDWYQLISFTVATYAFGFFCGYTWRKIVYPEVLDCGMDKEACDSWSNKRGVEIRTCQHRKA